MRSIAELILGTGLRPGAAVEMSWDDFAGDRMKVLDEKAGERITTHRPHDLRTYLDDLPKRGAYVLAKNLTQPIGYSACEKAFRAWRATLGPEAKPYSLHGLRKLTIIRLAEAGCSEAEIQAVTKQSVETVVYYRTRANRLALLWAAPGHRK
ncbi:hypothetical protein EKE94_03090 [Mesobaculum littorinae]|uniref:Tyr recombinase domain-containing protein n=1 Tax=Mesobaculum littorinae TaxID=2486419 RepID=A0A438ALX6_9RHOB|nr:tyrosine-type recombinase/integrase [Mesobaculum littorinae]RVV99682.1 hypothetical protein EKE94_03090 [Mesobaculum littorinae]